MGSAFYPLVSIIIPVYNGSNYLREAIHSALEQTYPNIEVLVINDGSTDNGATRDIAMSFSSRIRYFEKENGGVVSALNFGIDQMRGEYFAWLSHDDIYLPEKIEKQVRAIQEHQGSKPGFCICNCIVMDENENELGRTQIQKNDSFDQPACFLLLGGHGFSGIMVLIQKVLFDIYGKFTPSLATHEYDMWMRLMPAADVVIEPECLTKMRIHSQQVSKQKKQEVAEETDKFISNGIERIPPQDFQNFMLHQFRVGGIQQVTDMLNSYLLYQYLPDTSAQVLSQLRRMYTEINTGGEEFFTQVLGISDYKDVQSYCIQRNESGKPLVVMYCEQVHRETMEGAAIALAWLNARCDIALLYHQMEDSQLAALKEIGVMPIALATPDHNMPLKLGMLCHFMNAKLFWYYQVPNDLRFTVVFHMLKLLKIRTFASVSDIDTLMVNHQILSSKEVPNESVQLLMEAFLVSNSNPTHVLTPNKLWKFVTIPEHRLHAVACWKSIVDVLLETTNYSDVEEEIDKRILTGSKGSKAEVANYIKEYIQRYVATVDQRVTVAVEAYEKRTFWRLTKPLRLFVWLIRKSGKAIQHVFRQKESIQTIISRTRVALKNRRVSE